MMGLPIEKLVVATNENDVLDEFFRTGIYRVRKAAETYHTSSPSMDISKASNFERFVFDLLGRDPARVLQLFRDVEEKGGFDLAASGDFARVKEFGFVSGRSSHEDRVDAIRDVFERYDTMIDTHTADGLKVAREHLQAGIPMIVLETAQPIKFGETIREALLREPERPAAFSGTGVAAPAIRGAAGGRAARKGLHRRKHRRVTPRASSATASRSMRRREVDKKYRHGARSAAGRMTPLSLAPNVREHRFQMHHYRDCAGDPLSS